MTRHHLLVLMLLLLVTLNVHGASADDRLERIMMLWPSRDFARLRVQIDEALIAYREARDPRREATAYLFLSLVDMSLGDVPSTRVHFGEATTRLEAARDYAGAGLAYWMFAEHERLSGAQSDHVRAFFEKSLAMLEKAKSPSAPFSIDALMVIGPIVGVPPAEYEPNAATPAINKPIVLHLLEVFTRIGYGAEFLRIGELEKADAQLRRAKEAAMLFDGRLDPPIDRHIGNLRRRQWRLDEARESYRSALEGLKVLRPVGITTPKRLRVEIFAELAELEMLNGRIDDALAWNDRALEVVRAENSPETEIIVLRRRAETLVRGGRFAAAERVFAQALALAEEHEHFYLQVPIYQSRAQMNRARGRYGMAAADIEKSLEALGRSNEPQHEPAIWGNLAMMYVLLDANDSARDALERARELAEKTGRCLDVAAIDLLESARKYLRGELPSSDFQKAVAQWARTPDVLSVQGSEHFMAILTGIMSAAPVDLQLPSTDGTLAAGMAELLEAGVLFSQGRESARVRELAMKSLDVMANAKHRAGALTMIAGTYFREGDDEKAIAYFNKSVDALDTADEEARVDPFLSSSPGDGWSSPAFELLIRLLVKHSQYEEAFAVSERARARVFLQMIGNNRVSPRGPENTLPAQEAETLRTQMLQWQQQGRLAPATQLDDDLRQARRRYEALMTRVKASNPEYAAMTSVEPLQLDAIREELPSDATLVNYFVTENGAHAWVLDRTMLQYVPLPFDRTALARAQCAGQRFRAGGRGVRPLDTQCERATVEERHEQLFDARGRKTVAADGLRTISLGQGAWVRAFISSHLRKNEGLAPFVMASRSAPLTRRCRHPGPGRVQPIRRRCDLRQEACETGQSCRHRHVLAICSHLHATALIRHAPREAAPRDSTRSGAASPRAAHRRHV